MLPSTFSFATDLGVTVTAIANTAARFMNPLTTIRVGRSSTCGVFQVVSAVFVQQTMKTASSDEDNVVCKWATCAHSKPQQCSCSMPGSLVQELAFKQKERDVAMYTRKAGTILEPEATHL